MAQRAVGLAAGADDHARAEVRQRRAVALERVGGAAPAAQVPGAGLVAEAAEVDHALHALARAHRGKRLGGAQLALLEVAGAGAAAHRVHEVVGDVDAFAGARERRGVEHVALVDLERFDGQAARARGVAHERADLDAFVEQPLAQGAADEPRGSRDECAHRMRYSDRRVRACRARTAKEAGQGPPPFETVGLYWSRPNHRPDGVVPACEGSPPRRPVLISKVRAALRPSVPFDPLASKHRGTDNAVRRVLRFRSVLSSGLLEARSRTARLRRSHARHLARRPGSWRRTGPRSTVAARPAPAPRDGRNHARELRARHACGARLTKHEPDASRPIPLAAARCTRERQRRSPCKYA